MLSDTARPFSRTKLRALDQALTSTGAVGMRATLGRADISSRAASSSISENRTANAHSDATKITPPKIRNACG